MNDFLQVLTDILAVLFGDTPERPRKPQPLPPALPPPGPPKPEADPDEPQDSADITGADPVVISHEAESPRNNDGPEFDANPAPPPGEAKAGDKPSAGDNSDIPPITDPRNPNRPNPRSPDYKGKYMWCIDNGHGALTSGKRSPVLPDGRQLLEYEFNRDITARIFSELDRIGVAYFNVIPEVQVGNFLLERVDRANRLSSALPKLFVSIHGNAGPAPSPQDFTNDAFKGIETWYYHGSTKGRRMAAIFQRHLVDTTGMHNRHLRSKVTGQFYVLRATRMPAILTENGFFNNRFDLERMLTPEFRQLVADAHVQAILEIDRDGI